MHFKIKGAYTPMCQNTIPDKNILIERNKTQVLEKFSTIFLLHPSKLGAASRPPT
jgi:hypothetical protein